MIRNVLLLSWYLLLSLQTSAFMAPARVYNNRAFLSTLMSDLADESTTDDAAAAEESSSTGGKRQMNRERHTLFVGNLPFDINEDNLKEMFEKYGKVELLNIPKKRESAQSRGFAFIDMSTSDELEAAISGMDKTELSGRELRVTKSDPDRKFDVKDYGLGKGSKKLYIGNLPYEVTQEEIKDLFSKYGELKEVFIPQNAETGEGRGFAFIILNEDNADKAVKEMNGIEFNGRKLAVSVPLPPGQRPRRKPALTKMYVGNLSFYTVAETLEALFGEFGEVYDCYMPEDRATGGSRGFGFVTMKKDEAEMAIQELNGCEVDGRMIVVNEAQNKGKKKESSKPVDNFDDDYFDDDDDDGSGDNQKDEVLETSNVDGSC